jgi:ribonuclease HI
MIQKVIYLNTDGGSRGNPGPAGCGAVISDNKGTVLKKASKFLGIATNNEAEYQAVILGLETAKKMLGTEKLRETEIVVRMDSELVCRQLNGKYQLKEEKLFAPFIKIWNLRVKDIPNLKFTYIPREQNSIADGLANEAMDEVGTKQKTFF